MEPRPYSEQTAQAMDEEARKLVDEAYKRTLELLRERKTQVENLAKLLLEKETINHDDIVSSIGPRPFKSSKQYDEFINSWKPPPKEEEAKGAEAPPKEDDPVVPPNLSPA